MSQVIIDLMLEGEISFKYTFIPHRMSRNREEKHKQLNYICLLTCPQGAMVFEYSLGRVQAPSYHLRNTPDWTPNWTPDDTNEECETGKPATLNAARVAQKKGMLKGGGIVPRDIDVLYCLVADAEMEIEDFDDFCGNFGYDNDSVKAKGVYKAYTTQNKQVRRLLTPEILTKLIAAYVDY